MIDYMVSVYLLIHRCLYVVFSRLSLKVQTTCVVTYGDNVWPVAEQLALNNHRVYVFYDQKKAMIHDAPKHENIIYVPLNLFNRIIKLPYFVATSSHSIVDNYFVELASYPVRKNAKRFQVWHAAGAMKAFGLTAAQNKVRGERANARFRKVYQNYGQFIVPGMKCAEQFSKAHDLPIERFLPLGMPRTDSLVRSYTKTKERLIVFAPTYRENEDYDVMPYVKQLHERFTKQGYQFLVKLHPAVNVTNELEGIQFIDSKESIMPYLMKAEWVITDYSSIPFESCLFDTKLALFVPDLEEYATVPGLVDHYMTLIDAPIVGTVEELVTCIVKDQHGNARWADQWYDLTPGYATDRIIQHFYEKEDEH